MTRVSCEAVRDALLGGRPVSEPDLVAHAEGCAQCSALLVDRASLGLMLAGEPAPPEVEALPWSTVNDLLKEELGWRAWLQSRPTSLRLALGASGFALVTALGLWHLRADFGLVPKLELGALLAAFALTAFPALSAALPVLGRRPAGVRSRALVLTAAFVVPAITALVRTAGAPAESADTFGFLGRALGCFTYGSLLTAPLVALLWLLDRGAGTRSRGVLFAAVAGLAANAALTLHCPLDGSAHLLVGHAGIGAGLAALVWLLARRSPARAD